VINKPANGGPVKVEMPTAKLEIPNADVWFSFPTISVINTQVSSTVAPEIYQFYQQRFHWFNK